MIEALRALVAAVDEGFEGTALRIPNPGQRRAIVRAADAARAALAAEPPKPAGVPDDAWPSPGYIETSTGNEPGRGLE